MPCFRYNPLNRRQYKAPLLWHLTGQTVRFNQLHRLVPEATPKMLTQQLRELEEDGLISRSYPVVPPRVDYSLTALGESLFPILEAMYRWRRPDAGRRAYAGMYDDRQPCYGRILYSFCTKCRVAEHSVRGSLAKATTFLSRRRRQKKRTGELSLLFLSCTFKILSYTLACRTIPIPMGYGPVCTPIVAPI